MAIRSPYTTKRPPLSDKFLHLSNSGVSSLPAASSLRSMSVYNGDRSLRSFRLVQLSCAFFTGFIVLAAISFLYVRPALKEAKSEVQTEWQMFINEMRHRNELLPGMVETIRHFEPGHGKLAEKLLEARFISNRSSDSDTIIAAVDTIDQLLNRIERLAAANPELKHYPPFAAQWGALVKSSQKMAFSRIAFNSSGRVYNRLLAAFPQNLFTSLFAFAPVNIYPAGRPIGDD